MTSLVGMLFHTPWWVFLVFACLLFVGIRSVRDREVKTVWNLAVTPVLFLYVYVRNLMQVDESYFVFISGTLCLIAMVVACFFLKNTVKVGKHMKIMKKGSYSTLVCAMTTFFVRYFCEYKLATTGETYAALRLLSSGIIGGFSFGRNLKYFIEIRKLKKLL